MTQFVPASTKIRYKRVSAIDTDRLQRRLAYFDEHGAAMARACDARIEVRFLAREKLAIMAELTNRSNPNPTTP